MATRTVPVRLYGRYRELSATPELHLELPAEATVADLVRVLHGLHPERLPERPVVAVNHSPASDDTKVSARDDVALIPPVAGG